MNKFQPMKAVAVTEDQLDGLEYPLFVSPKLDGIRATVIDGVLMSKSLKPIRNLYCQGLFGHHLLDGLDGELIVGPPTAPDVYVRTSSGVMSKEGTPDVKFMVFDDATDKSMPFSTRWTNVQKRVHAAARKRGTPFMVSQLVVHPHTLVNTAKALRLMENQFCDAGYEGLMVRHPAGEYKYGRSTLNEGWLLKLKRFTDSEAEIVDYYALSHNKNELEVDNLGHSKRSKKKAGMVVAEELGGFVVRDVVTGIEFEVGSGFSAAERVDLWKRRSTLVGQLVKYKAQLVGVKVKPRFPTFLGFRDPIDM